MSDVISDTGEKVGGIVAAIITLAVVAVVVSNGANTSNVVGAFFRGVTGLLGVAISPVTGQTINTSGLTGGTWANGGNITGGLTTNTGGAGNVGGLLNSGAGLLNGLLNSGGGSGGGGGFVDSGAFTTPAAVDNAFNTGSFDAGAAALDTIF